MKIEKRRIGVLADGVIGKVGGQAASRRVALAILSSQELREKVARAESGAR